MTDIDLDRLKSMQIKQASIDEAAATFGVHKGTLRRRVLIDHGMVIEAVSSFRLIPIGDHIAKKKARQATPQ